MPFTADDATIQAALEVADLPALVPAIAYTTGDLTLLRPELRIYPALMLEDQGGLTADQQASIRTLAAAALARFRDSGGEPAPPPHGDQLTQIMAFLCGTEVDAYHDMLVEELAPEGSDPRAPAWRAAELPGGTDFTVAIIGAGMSGIAAAYRLRQAGIAYTVYDKNPDVGGTWLENTYPGCRVDVGNHFYSYSFAQRDDWPQFYSSQPELERYFRDCVDRFGIRADIRFGTEVSSLTWDAEGARWSLELRHADGSESVASANAVISAVGQLNRPQLPAITGRESFAGPSFHSAQWDHGVSLAGKRVAVIGTGCSAAQFIPIIATEAASLEIFQRTPNWMFPVPHYTFDVPGPFQYLLRHLPAYRQWYRFWLFWRGAEALRPSAEVDPGWPDQDRSVSPLNDMVRQVLTDAITPQYADRPDLLDKVLPTYPPASKRIIVDNGSWAETLKRDNVTLTTTAIERMTPAGVVTVDGARHDFDVVIYGTGFQPSRFLTPMKVVGRGGVDLHGRWDGDARAYLGVTVPDFPNFFLMYGPNTNIVLNGSIIWFSECEVRYITDCLRALLAGGHRALTVRPEVHDAYNVEVDAENRRMVWGVSTVNSWYKNERGRVAQNWPFTLLEYWRRTRAVSEADYEFD